MYPIVFLENQKVQMVSICLSEKTKIETFYGILLLVVLMVALLLEICFSINEVLHYAYYSVSSIFSTFRIKLITKNTINHNQTLIYNKNQTNLAYEHKKYSKQKQVDIKFKKVITVIIKKRIQIQKSGDKMFQSFSRNGNVNLKLSCHKCHNKVQDQFVLLLCDHVICANCLEDIMADQQIYNQNVYEGLKCVCGLITCFKTGTIIEEGDLPAGTRAEIRASSRVETRGQSRPDNESGTLTVNIHNNNRNPRSSTNVSTRPSVGLIHSKNTTSTKNVSRILNIQTHLDDSVGSNPPPNQANQDTINFIRQSTKLGSQLIKSNIVKEKSLRKSKQERERFLLQRSKYPIQSIKKLQQFVERQKQMEAIQSSLTREKKRSKKIANQQRHYQPKYIDSESVADQSITNENEVPNNKTNKSMKYTFNSKGVDSYPEQMFESSCDTVIRRKQYALSKQLRSQLSYLKLTHSKNLETLQRAYNQAKQKINNDYIELEDSLKDLCMESMALGRDSSSHVDLGKLIKMRYETYVGNPTEKLISTIKNSNISSINRELYESRVHRFSSPQISTKLQNQRLAVYSPKTNYNFRIENDGNCRSKYKITSTHTPLSQLESKLYKKGRNKTNIVIEL